MLRWKGVYGISLPCLIDKSRAPNRPSIGISRRLERSRQPSTHQHHTSTTPAPHQHHTSTTPAPHQHHTSARFPQARRRLCLLDGTFPRACNGLQMRAGAPPARPLSDEPPSCMLGCGQAARHATFLGDLRGSMRPTHQSAADQSSRAPGWVARPPAVTTSPPSPPLLSPFLLPPPWSCLSRHPSSRAHGDPSRPDRLVYSYLMAYLYYVAWPIGRSAACFTSEIRLVFTYSTVATYLPTLGRLVGLTSLAACTAPLQPGVVYPYHGLCRTASTKASVARLGRRMYCIV